MHYYCILLCFYKGWCLIMMFNFIVTNSCHMWLQSGQIWHKSIGNWLDSPSKVIFYWWFKLVTGECQILAKDSDVTVLFVLEVPHIFFRNWRPHMKNNWMFVVVVVVVVVFFFGGVGVMQEYCTYCKNIALIHICDSFSL